MGWLLGAGTLLVIGHSFFLFGEIAEPAQGAPGEVVFWLCVAPLLLVGLMDFRAALLFSIVAIPIFHIPTIPHLFTQGTGDLFMLITFCSFLFCHWRQVTRMISGVQILLLLIPAAALLSIFFNLMNSDQLEWNQFKYQVAELSGLSLAIAYSLLLTWSIRTEKDLKILLFAVFIAAVISVVQGFISLILISVCMPDLGGTIMSAGGQVRGGIGNPNYYGSWMLVLLPVVLYQISNQHLTFIKSTAYVILLAIFLLLLLMTVSRSTLLTLIFVLLAWGCFVKGRINKLKIIVIVLLIAIFFPSAWNARFKACSNTHSSHVDYVLSTNILAFIQGDISEKFLYRKTTESPQTHLNAAANEHPTRMQLLMFSWEAWESSPIFGVGPGNLTSFVRDRTGIGERAHNIPATILSEQGVLGLFAWLALWVVLLRRIWSVGWGYACNRSYHSVLGKYLFLVFLSLSIVGLFADQNRVIWMWLFVGLVLSPYFSADNRASVALGNKEPESSV